MPAAKQHGPKGLAAADYWLLAWLLTTGSLLATGCCWLLATGYAAASRLAAHCWLLQLLLFWRKDLSVPADATAAGFKTSLP